MARILIVDDDPDILETLELALSTTYDVRTATDGQEGIVVLDGEAQIDLVILDLMMPRMSGAEMLGELRARGNRVPVILASASHDVRQRAEELNAADYVAKPFSLRLLREKIEAVLARGDGGATGGGEGMADVKGGDGGTRAASVSFAAKGGCYFGWCRGSAAQWPTTKRIGASRRIPNRS